MIITPLEIEDLFALYEKKFNIRMYKKYVEQIISSKRFKSI
jgi:hypothetical protein